MEFNRKGAGPNDDDASVSDEEERGNNNNNNRGPSSSTAAPAAALRHEDEFYLKSPFPWKLQQLLEDVTGDNNEHIISWIPEGNAFQIHKATAFERDIMPQYFRQTKFKSFTRQVSIGRVSADYMSRQAVETHSLTQPFAPLHIHPLLFNLSLNCSCTCTDL